MENSNDFYVYEDGLPDLPQYEGSLKEMFGSLHFESEGQTTISGRFNPSYPINFKFIGIFFKTIFSGVVEYTRCEDGRLCGTVIGEFIKTRKLTLLSWTCIVWLIYWSVLFGAR